MTKSEIETLVSTAIRKDRAIERLKEDLKTIKETLVAEATHHEDEFTKTEGGGCSWIAKGKGEEIARVTFPAKSLKKAFDPAVKTFDKIKTAAGKAFAKLFKEKKVYVTVENFRDEAKSELNGGASRLIKLCESDSNPSVSFEVVEKAS